MYVRYGNEIRQTFALKRQKGSWGGKKKLFPSLIHVSHFWRLQSVLITLCLFVILVLLHEKKILKIRKIFAFARVPKLQYVCVM